MSDSLHITPGALQPMPANGPPPGTSTTRATLASALRAPDHPLMRALCAAVMSAGPNARLAGWRPSAGGAFVSQRTGFDIIRVGFCGDACEGWSAMEGASALTLDVLLALVSRAAGSDPAGLQVLRTDDVLVAKGCRRCGKERELLRMQIAAEVRRLSRLCFGMFEEPLFEFLPVVGDPGLILYRLAPAARAQLGDCPVRSFPAQLIQFDHRQNRGADVLAKKLGLYAALNCPPEGRLVRRVRSVLRGAGSLTDALTGLRGGRLADRFEEAVLRLRESRLYHFRQGAIDPAAGSVRVKGWVHRWLDSELVIEVVD